MKTISRCLIILMFSCGPSLAQADSDDDEAFDEAIKNYGYAGGAAWQCAEEGGKKDIVSDAMRVYSGLAQLFGTDRAFFFSAAFGAGTVDQIEAGLCDQYTADFAAGLETGMKVEDSE